MTTPTPRIPLNEPQTPTGREFLQSLTTDGQPGRVRRRPISEWILAIEREAQAIPLINVELLRKAMTSAGLGMPYIDSDPIENEDAERVAAEYVRLASESSTTDYRCDYRCSLPRDHAGPHLFPTLALPYARLAALPVKEGEPE